MRRVSGWFEALIYFAGDVVGDILEEILEGVFRYW